MTPRLHGFAAAALAACVGCGAAPLRVSALDDMDRARASPSAREGAERAPEAYARAEREREIAQAAHAAGDNVGATLHAQHAIAGYSHALAVARLAHATAEMADAQKSLDESRAQNEVMEAARLKLDREAAELEQRVAIAHESRLPASSAPASPQREAARRTAALAMITEARLLCSAARLVAADADGLASAEAVTAALGKQLESAAQPTPIDDVAQSRAGCLDVLTRARRAVISDDARADQLLTELSASGLLAPTADERGVVVTLRGAYRGTELTENAVTTLRELGRVAAAHPSFGVQVVVHDTTQPPANDVRDAQRADAAVQALIAGGANGSRVAAELAGARAPVVDPADPKARSRNERIEVVFVGK